MAICGMVFLAADVDTVIKLAKHGGDRRSEKVRNQGVNHSLKYGTGNRAYTLARLQRDNPDLAKRVSERRLSARAAAIEAGITKPPSRLDKLKRLWTKASVRERSVYF